MKFLTAETQIHPGHNSIVRGPNGDDSIVFHAWDLQMTARRMFIELARH